MKYIKLKSGEYATLDLASGYDEAAELVKVFGADVDQVFDTPPAEYLAQVAAQQVVAAEAQASKTAAKELQRLRLEAIDDLITWAAGQAVGLDRAKMQAKLAALNAEKAKIK